MAKQVKIQKLAFDIKALTDPPVVTHFKRQMHFKL